MKKVCSGVVKRMLALLRGLIEPSRSIFLEALQVTKLLDLLVKCMPQILNNKLNANH